VSFIQIIKVTTTRPDELEARVDSWKTDTAGRRSVAAGLISQMMTN